LNNWSYIGFNELDMARCTVTMSDRDVNEHA
jgi:hypothetical protein